MFWYTGYDMPIKSDRELIESYAMARNDAAFAEFAIEVSGKKK